jgi:hypothetical protein
VTALVVAVGVVLAVVAGWPMVVDAASVPAPLQAATSTIASTNRTLSFVMVAR